MSKPLKGNLQDLAYKYFLVTNKKAFNKLIKRLGIEDNAFLAEDMLGCCALYEDEGIAIVSIKEGLSTETAISVLIHEAVHLWQAHCKWIQEDKPGDEIEAYAIQKIASELIKEYIKGIDDTAKLPAPPVATKSL